MQTPFFGSSLSRAQRFLRGSGIVASAGICYYIVYKDSNPVANDNQFTLTPPRDTKRYAECVKLLKKHASSCDPITRDQIISRMKQHSSKENPADFFVIGGGAVGSASALEAQSRGMKVVLAEQEDFASGASSKSSKLLHGGVRYLEKAFLGMQPAQLKLVFEALGERSIALSQAPHLCHELPTLVPCFSKFDLLWFWGGLKTYDLLALLSGSSLPVSRIAWPNEVRRWFPSLRHSSYADPYNNNKVVSDSDVLGNKEKTIQEDAVRSGKEPLNAKQRLQGAIIYYDGQMDDARLNVSLALTANALGAACGNYCSVTGFIFDEEKRRVIGANVKDNVSGEAFPVYARSFLNASGAFSDTVRQMVARDQTGGSLTSTSSTTASPSIPQIHKLIVPSYGTHITLPQALTTSSASHGGGNSPALLIPQTKDGRVLFVIPWNGRTIAGTTDRVGEVTNTPSATSEDVGFILETLKPYFTYPVEKSDVLSSWCGIRPLALSPENIGEMHSEAEAKAASQKIVREHIVFGESGVSGFASIAGGKWTTYNKMACDAVAQTLDIAGDEKLKQEIVNQPVSKYLRLVGALQVPHNLELICAEALDKTEKKMMYLIGKNNQENDHELMSLLREQTGKYCKTEVAKHLATSYGDRSFLILDMILKDQQDLLASTTRKNQQKKKEASVWSSWFGGNNNIDKNKRDFLGLDILYPSLPILSIEVLYACRYEMCESPADFLCRRTRAAFLEGEGILSSPIYVKKVAELMAKEKGWDEKKMNQEIQDSIQKLKKGFQAI